jgi:hypothetical protein
MADDVVRTTVITVALAVMFVIVTARARHGNADDRRRLAQSQQ